VKRVTTVKRVTVCKVCGSDNVKILQWLNPNDEADFGDIERTWCDTCEEHNDLIEVKR
jgi:hypothetical protein